MLRTDEKYTIQNESLRLKVQKISISYKLSSLLMLSSWAPSQSELGDVKLSLMSETEHQKLSLLRIGHRRNTHVCMVFIFVTTFGGFFFFFFWAVYFREVNLWGRIAVFQKRTHTKLFYTASVKASTCNLPLRACTLDEATKRWVRATPTEL